MLLLASIVGVAALLPYLVSFFQNFLSTYPLPMPWSLLMLVQIMQSAILFAAFISLGLILAPKAGIEMPVLRAWFYGGAAPPKNWAGSPALAGAAVAAILLLVFYTLFLPHIPEWPVGVEAALPIWKRLLSCLYGAINEEIVARLFMLSLLLWLFRTIGREQSPQASPIIFWIANLIVAGLFALGHVPAAKIFLQLTPLVIVALFTLNGCASLLFGYLYWKRGLEAAMVAHFSADIMLHVISPMLFRG
jgi:hypothetical protein